MLWLHYTTGTTAQINQLLRQLVLPSKLQLLQAHKSMSEACNIVQHGATWGAASSRSSPACVQLVQLAKLPKKTAEDYVPACIPCRPRKSVAPEMQAHPACTSAPRHNSGAYYNISASLSASTSTAHTFKSCHLVNLSLVTSLSHHCHIIALQLPHSMLHMRAACINTRQGSQQL